MKARPRRAIEHLNNKKKLPQNCLNKFRKLQHLVISTHFITYTMAVLFHPSHDPFSYDLQ